MRQILLNIPKIALDSAEENNSTDSYESWIFLSITMKVYTHSAINNTRRVSRRIIHGFLWIDNSIVPWSISRRLFAAEDTAATDWIIEISAEERPNASAINHGIHAIFEDHYRVTSHYASRSNSGSNETTNAILRSIISLASSPRYIMYKHYETLLGLYIHRFLWLRLPFRK